MQPTAEARVYFRKAGVSALQASNTSFVATGSGAVSDRLSFGAVSYRYVPLPLLNDVPQAALSLCCVPIFNWLCNSLDARVFARSSGDKIRDAANDAADGVAYCAT